VKVAGSKPVRRSFFLIRLVVKRDELLRIKKFVKTEIGRGRDPQHDFGHLDRVAKNALKIVNILKIKLDESVLVTACYLHDLNHRAGHPSLLNYFSETKTLKRILPGILGKFKLSRKEKKIISEAIYNSPYSFPFRKLNKKKDLYSQVLQDADTIDFFSPEREKSFLRARKKFIFYKFLSPFSFWALGYGRKNLEKYLNFTQLAERFYV
jgi:hypothetical protein